MVHRQGEQMNIKRLAVAMMLANGAIVTAASGQSMDSYTIWVKTSDIADAGTNANVCIKLQGNQLQTEPILLDVDGCDDFERNSYNSFGCGSFTSADSRVILVAWIVSARPQGRQTATVGR